jgi:hypothetical protein
MFNFCVQKITRQRRHFHCNRSRALFVFIFLLLAFLVLIISHSLRFPLKERVESDPLAEKGINRAKKKTLAASCMRNSKSFYADKLPQKNPLGLIIYKTRPENNSEKENDSGSINSNRTTSRSGGIFLNNHKCNTVLNNINNEINYTLHLSPHFPDCSVKAKTARPLLLAVVIVAPERFDRRETIRRTWATSSRHVSSNHTYKSARNRQRTPPSAMTLAVVFVMGRATAEKLNEKIKREHEQHGDILQFSNFNDSYHFLTVKVIGSFWWAHTHCSAAQLIMRVNDDVVVNTPILLPFLHNVLSYITVSDKSVSQSLTSPTAKIIMGNLFPASPVSRDQSYKFFISPDEYTSDSFVPYMEGSAYVITRNLASEFCNLSRRLAWPPFSTWLEDIYIAGLMSLQLNASFLNLQRHYSAREQYASLNVDFVKKWSGYEQASQARKKSNNQQSSLLPMLYFVYIQRTEQMSAVWNLFVSPQS